MKKLWYVLLALSGRPSIVQFTSDKFGVRKGILMHHFLDLTGTNKNYWWFGTAYVEKYCYGSLEQAATALAEYMPRARRGKLIALKW